MTSEKFLQSAKATAEKEKMTLQQVCQKTLTEDQGRCPKKIWNQTDLQLNWSDKEKIYAGIEELCTCQHGKHRHEISEKSDDKDTCNVENCTCKKFTLTAKREWIEALQHTEIPIFEIHCPALVRKGNIEAKCGAANFVSILGDGTKQKCRMCNNEFEINLVIPESSAAYQLYAALYPEKIVEDKEE